MTLIDKAEALAKCKAIAEEAKQYGMPQMAMGAFACAEAIAALAPTDAAHVNETPKSEHDGADVLTAAQARETALKKAAQLAYEVWDDPEALAKAILALIGKG